MIKLFGANIFATKPLAGRRKTMQDQKIFMKNEVELFREDGYWYVTDDEAGGYCEQYFNYEKALKDYEKRVKDKIEKRYTKSKSA